jgi:ribonucleoside-diphosphate reductase alpha chain
MGFQDALYKIDAPYGSDEAVTFADRSMEAISYFAIEASSELASERGTYSPTTARCGAKAFSRWIRSTF